MLFIVMMLPAVVTVAQPPAASPLAPLLQDGPTIDEPATNIEAPQGEGPQETPGPNVAPPAVDDEGVPALTPNAATLTPGAALDLSPRFEPPAFDERRFANSTTDPRNLFRTPAAGAFAGLASVPYMIGDTNAGTCFALRGIVDADIGHPTLTCSRLNISENNSAVPTDRVYYSYRHFHNATQLRVFDIAEDFDVDRHVLGVEKTFADGLLSLECRVPIVRRISSDITAFYDPEFSGIVDLISEPEEDYEVGLGNISLIGKALLLRTDELVWSAGLGVTIPTAEDVDYELGSRGTLVSIADPRITAFNVSIFSFEFENETVYLSPFTSWLYQPRRSRWFHQGFLQIEVAANPSTANTTANGASFFQFNGVLAGFGQFNLSDPFDPRGPQPVPLDVFAQTLMRLNLGVGYELLRLDPRRRISAARAMFEIHHTSTLQESNRTVAPLIQSGGGVGLGFPQFVQLGNAELRSDIVNAAAGLTVNVGSMAITNGFVAPLREAPDRGFDFEYNLQVQYLF